LTNLLEMCQDSKFTVWRDHPAEVWFAIDTHPWAVLPHRYAIRNSPGGIAAKALLSAWRLEGSRDGAAWVTLHDNRNIFNGEARGSEFSPIRNFRIQEAAEAHGPMTRFRLTQTGSPFSTDTESSTTLGLSGFELYGTVCHIASPALSALTPQPVVLNEEGEPGPYVTPGIPQIRAELERSVSLSCGSSGGVDFRQLGSDTPGIHIRHPAGQMDRRGASPAMDYYDDTHGEGHHVYKMTSPEHVDRPEAPSSRLHVKLHDRVRRKGFKN